jgi:hypothetical protein
MKKLYAYKKLIRVYSNTKELYETVMQSGHKVIHLSDVDIPTFFIDSRSEPYIRAPEYDIVIGEGA